MNIFLMKQNNLAKNLQNVYDSYVFFNTNCHNHIRNRRWT